MTEWQDEQNAILDRVEAKINTLPKRIGNTLRCGIFRECRAMVNALDGRIKPQSSHRFVAKMVEELDAELDLIQVRPAETRGESERAAHPANGGGS